MRQTARVKDLVQGLWVVEEGEGRHAKRAAEKESGLHCENTADRRLRQDGDEKVEVLLNKTLPELLGRSIYIYLSDTPEVKKT